MIKAAIIGGSGYVGGELLRLLLCHPQVEVVKVTSQNHIGEKVSNIHQNLNKICSLIFEKEELSKISQKVDILFLALPAGESMVRIKKLDLQNIKVIDLGADFRLRNSQLFKKTYGLEHVDPVKLKEAIYGLTEIKRELIKKASLVACPGCFPTAVLLSLYPLAKEGLIENTVIVDAKTGSSGSGIKPSFNTHHPERAHDFKAYSIFSHRHLPEIVQELSVIQGKQTKVIFTPHSTPMVRGIFTTSYITLSQKISKDKLHKLYERFYLTEPFIRMVNEPRCAVVLGTNFCDISVHVEGKEAIIISAIDNLVKGAAGQAVQNMNIMFGLPETTGLESFGIYP